MRFNELIAWRFLGAAQGAFYLNAAYACVQFWDGYTVPTTKVLVADERMAVIGSAIGCAVMAIGGLCYLTGYWVRIGALLLVGFLAGGTIIHYRMEKQSAELQNQVQGGLGTAAATPNAGNASTPDPAKALSELAGSCQGAHRSSWLKNLVLLALALFYVIFGWNGPSSLFQRTSWYSY
jgi:hypothetical protein